MKPAPTKFWLVWSPQGDRPPSYRHASYDDAKNEARRLAALHPGKEFFVLEAVGGAKRVDVEWVDITEQDPF